MTAPVRIQRRRIKGWRMPADTVYVGRPTKWGNPFWIKYHRDAAASVDYYRRWLAGETDLGVGTCTLNPGALRGKDLACWCALDRACHADVLLELANAPSAVSHKPLAISQQLRANG